MGFINTLLAIVASYILTATAAPLSNPLAAGAVHFYDGGALAPKSDVTSIINEFCRLFNDSIYEKGPQNASETYQYNGNSIFMVSNITESGNSSITVYRCVDYLTSVQIQCAHSQSGSVVTDDPAGALYMTVNPPQQLGPIVERRNDPAASTCAGLEGVSVTDDQAREAYSFFCESGNGDRIEAGSQYDSTVDVSGSTIKMQITAGKYVPWVINEAFCSASYKTLLSNCSNGATNTTHGSSYSVGDRGLSFSLNPVSNSITKRDDPLNYCSDHTYWVTAAQAQNAYGSACNVFAGQTFEKSSGDVFLFGLSGSPAFTAEIPLWTPQGAPYTADVASCNAAFERLVGRCTSNAGFAGGAVKLGIYDDAQYTFWLYPTSDYHTRDVDDNTVASWLEVRATPEKRLLPVGFHDLPNRAPGSKRGQLPHGPVCSPPDSSDSASIEDAKIAIAQACDEFAGNSISAGYHITKAVPISSSKHVFIMSIMAPVNSDMTVDPRYCLTSFGGLLQECWDTTKTKTVGGTWSWGEGQAEYVMGLDTNAVQSKRELATSSRRDAPACTATGGPSIGIRDAKIYVQSFCNIVVAFPIYPNQNVNVPWDIDGGYTAPQIKSSNSQPVFVSHQACTQAFDYILSSCEDYDSPDAGTFTGGSLDIPADSLEYIITVNSNNVLANQQLNSTDSNQDPYYICPPEGESYPQDQAKLDIKSFCRYNSGLAIEAGQNQTNMYVTVSGDSHLILQVLAVDNTAYCIETDACNLAFADVLNYCGDNTAHTIHGGGVYYPPKSVTYIIRTEDIPPPPTPPEKRDVEEVSHADAGLNLAQGYQCTFNGSRISDEQATDAAAQFCNTYGGQALSGSQIYSQTYSEGNLNLDIQIRTASSESDSVDYKTCVQKFGQLISQCSINKDTLYGGTVSMGINSTEFIVHVQGNSVSTKREETSSILLSSDNSIAKRNLPEGTKCNTNGATLANQDVEGAVTAACNSMDTLILVGNQVYINVFNYGDLVLEIQIRTTVGESDGIDYIGCLAAFDNLILSCSSNGRLYGAIHSNGPNSMEFVIHLRGNTNEWDPTPAPVVRGRGLSARETGLVPATRPKRSDLETRTTVPPTMASGFYCTWSGQSVTVQNAHDAIAHACAMIDGVPLALSEVYVNAYSVNGLTLETQIHAGTGEQSIGNDICLLNFGLLLAKCSNDGNGGEGGDPFYGGIQGTGVGSIELVLHVAGNAAPTGQSAVGRRRRDLETIKANTVQLNTLQQNELSPTTSGTTRCYTSNHGAPADVITPKINDFCYRYGNKYIMAQRSEEDTFTTTGSSGPSWIIVSNGQALGDWFYLDTDQCLEVFTNLVDDCVTEGSSDKPGGTFTLEGGQVQFVLNVDPASPV